MLESYIREQRARREVLLMTHIVVGYPNLDDSLRLVEAMVKAGVELMELQIPFSEPTADGPVILHANQRALEGGTTVEQALRFGEAVAARFDIPFLFMTYYNILFRRGVDAFVGRMRRGGLRGAIVPDLPPEEAREYLEAMRREELAPVFIYSPNSSSERMKTIDAAAEGFIYCVARKGVTGSNTSFAPVLDSYLARCRASTRLPLAVGFGVKQREDVDYLRGKADIAVVGSETLRVFETQGLGAVEGFLRSLRPS